MSLPGAMTRTPAPTGRRALQWAWFCFSSLFGVMLVTFPLRVDEPMSATAAAGLVLFGLAVLTVPVAGWITALAPARPARAVSSHDEVVEIRLRTAGPVATVVIGVTWAGFFAWAWVAGGITSGGLLAVPLLLLFLALVPDSVRAVARRPFLRIDADQVVLHGWSIDARVDWDDVVTVEATAPHPQRAVVRLVAAPGASSLQRTWKRLILRLDLRGPEPVVDVPFAALDDPGRVTVYLALLQLLPRAGRQEHLTEPGPGLLRGDPPETGRGD